MRSLRYEKECPVVQDRLDREASLAADEAFIALLKAAIATGTEKAVHGVFVDRTPPIGIRRIYGDMILSSCGSPAAMCAESAGMMAGATQTMKG